jgi:hypothetical protein
MNRQTFTARRISFAIAIPALLVFVAATVTSNSNLVSKARAAPAKKEQSKNRKQKLPRVTFNEKGELLKPKGYRRWTYVGTPLTPNDMNDGNAPFPEFHSVYINPEAYRHYQKTGEFPDGTVLVKELVSVGDKEASSGKGYFMGEFIGLEVSLKDEKRFRDEPGNWAYFSFGHSYPLKKKAVAQPTSSCNSCHDGEAEDDFVFTQYYPVLRAAKSRSAASK